MAANVLRTGVIGGSTLLGRELLNEIGNSAAAAWELRVLEEGDETERQLTSAGDEALVVQSLDEDSLAGLDVVFFAGAPEVTLQYVGMAIAAGAAVVDLTGATFSQPGFVMRSPWVSTSRRPDLTTSGVCVPHPAASVLAIVGERLQRRFGTVELVTTILEPASQAGSAGVDELHQQTVGLLSFQDLTKTVFDAQVAFNLLGALGEEAQLNVAATLARIERDLQLLLAQTSGVKAHLQLLQAPVFHGYVLSTHVSCDSQMVRDEVEAALEGAPVTMSAEVEPSNKNATESGDLLVSFRSDAQDETACWLLLAVDNLGLMARGAIAGAMELVALRPGSRVQ